MRIGVIGTGNMGTVLTRRLRSLGHDVFMANSRGPGTLTRLAAETGAEAVDVAGASPGMDVVILAVPERAVPHLPANAFNEAADGCVVVDIGNYYPRQRDGLIAAIEAGMPESSWVSQQIGRPVVKAFNTIYARRLMAAGLAPGSPGRIALPVAGDDPRAKAVVLRLVDQLGFDAVDAGVIDQSWRQQPGTPVYVADLDAGGVRRALAAASPERQPEFRATPNSPGTFQSPA